MTVELVLTLLGLALGFVLMADLRTPKGRGASRRVSVIVPARNEEGSLPNLLRSIADQTLVPAEVIVVDDGSTDATSAIATRSGATLVHAPPLREGWVGKSWACHMGSLRATTETFVFLDADAVLAPDGLERIVVAWERTAADGLLSVQPFHTTVEGYEQLSAYPNLLSVMATGAFAPMRERWSPIAFGPCLVTGRDAYRSVGGHEAVASEVIEDLALARVYGAAGRPVEALAGGTAISYRMYPGGPRQLIDGWTKNLAGGPGMVSVVPMLASVLWVLAAVVAGSNVVQLGVESLVGTASGVERWTAVAVWGLASVQVAVLLRRIGRFSWWSAPAFPVLLAGFVALFFRSAIHRTVRRTVSWHDRSVPVRSR